MAEPEHEHEPDDETPPDDETAEAEEQHEHEHEQQEEQAAKAAKAKRAPKSEKEIERALKNLESAGTSYRNRVSTIMGEDAQDLIPCPRCNAPTLGLVFDPEKVPVDDDVRAATLASLGEGPNTGPPLQPAKGVETCPSCQGNGRLEFPTFVEHTRVQPCPKCTGAGYVTANEPASQVYNFPTTPSTTTGYGEPTTTGTFPDAWQRPPGHPHYGIPPAQAGIS